MKTLRIGSGAGYSGDRIEPAVELAEQGDLDYLVFECLAERTIALAQQARISDPQGGYDPLLSERMRRVLPFVGEHEGRRRLRVIPIWARPTRCRRPVKCGASPANWAWPSRSWRWWAMMCSTCCAPSRYWITARPLARWARG